MALDKVVGEILESARKDANQLLAAGEKERGSILQQASENIAAKRAERQRQLEDSVRRMKQQEVSSAELDAKRIILNAKKEVLDRTFQEAMGEINRMSDSERSRLYGKILGMGISVIPKPKVYCPRGDARLVSSMPGVGSVQEREMGPGLILESADGTVLLDYRFKTILDEVWEKELKNISSILFG